MKRVSILIVTLLLVGGGAWVIFGNQNSVGQSNLTSQQTQPETQSASSSDGTNEENTIGKYVDYSERAFASASGERLLFFHAPWCPQCRQLEDSIESSDVPAGVTIFKVDYDSNQDLRKKYGVTIQTTVVKVDTQGNTIKKFVAYDDPTLASVKQNLL